jgi:hypothetical protein
MLLVFQTALRSNTSIDLNKLNIYLQSALEKVNAIQAELDGRLVHAIELLGESRDEIRNQISFLRGGFDGLELDASSLAPDRHRVVPFTREVDNDSPPTTAMLT